MEIIRKHYTELSTDELYAILKLRAEVFVVEQECPYQDLDGNDLDAFHLFAKDGDEVVAYMRIFLKDSATASIGRVVASRKVRGTGLAGKLMMEALDIVRTEYGRLPVVIHAQSYAAGFYRKCGFEITSEEFLEDNIPHVEMTCSPV